MSIMIILIVWFVLAYSFRRSTCVDQADPLSYNLLLNRLYRLDAWLSILEAGPPNIGVDADVSKKEVETYFNAAIIELTKRSGSWASGIGYVNVSRLIHRAEEALIRIEPQEALFQDATHDEISLNNSTIETRDNCLNALRKALKIITNEEPSTTALNQQPLQKNQTYTGGSHTDVEVMSNESVDPVNDDIRQIRARVIIREVRLLLDQSFDDQWEKLAHVRNQLTRITLLTGLVLYLLVLFIFIEGVTPALILPFAFFFLIGALVGLFSRLYEQLKTNTSADNIRLAGARLLAAPLLSGLAAIGGVIITLQLIPSNHDTAVGLNIFNVLVSLTFGLTPGLLINSIEKQASSVVLSKSGRSVQN